MNISYKLLLTAILLTTCANSVFATADEPQVLGEPVAAPVDASAIPTDAPAASTYASDVKKTTLTSRLSKMAINAKDAAVAAPSKAFASVKSAGEFAKANKLKTGAGVAVAAAVVAGAVVAYKMYAASEDTVESLEAAIEALNAEITQFNTAGNAKEAFAKITARKALEAKLAELQTKIATEDADEEATK